MSNPTTIIHKAFENLKGSISVEHRHTFKSTSLQDVWTATHAIQADQRKRHSAQNLKRIEPLLQALEKYAKVIEVLCNGTQYLSFIWAPIKLMLKLASDHRDIFETLLDAYSEIGSALPRFDRYASTFKDNPEFQYVLAGIYASILEFHQRAYKFFQRRAWRMIFLSLWKDFRARFQGILTTIEKHRDFIDKEASSIDMFEGRAARIRILHDMEERQRQSTAQLDANDAQKQLSQLQNSVSWLAIDDKPQETERCRRSMMKHKGTFNWIAHVPEIESWLKNDDSESIVWLNGKPGAGKSVLCTSIIDLAEKSNLHNICYYFCNNQDDGRDNPSERILGIVAVQLLRANHKENPELASLIMNEYVSLGSSSSLKQLKSLVPKLLELLSGTRIIIDGIDECSKSGQKALLQELQSSCVGPSLHCKLLLSSRKEPNIKAELQKCPTISLDGHEKVDQDIQSYVAHKIQIIQSEFIGELEPDVFDDMAQTLANKADGMFLWVNLITKELEQCYCRNDLEECIRRLPHGLDKAYVRILDRMTDQEVSPHIRSLSVRILEWMSCSYKRLKIYEVLDGVSIHPNRLSLDKESKLPSRVLDLCRPLIEEGPSNTVQFVHFSAQEYILKAVYRHGNPFILLREAHLNIGFSCVSYLNTSFLALQLHGNEEETMRSVVQGLHGLQIYANSYWYKHIKAYMDLAVAQGLDIPEYLQCQLKDLLKYQKVSSPEKCISSSTSTASRQDVVDTLPSLQKVPGLRMLVANLENFRNGLKSQDWSQKEVEDVSANLRAADPSFFSSVLHCYQSTVEALLSSSVLQHPLRPSEDDVSRFRNTYGDSAYICRYVHCERSITGFGSHQDRAKHEAKHRRVFRCNTPLCPYPDIGFATRAQLNRHVRSAHAQSDEVTLANVVMSHKARNRLGPAKEPNPLDVLQDFDFDAFLNDPDWTDDVFVGDDTNGTDKGDMADGKFDNAFFGLD